VTGYFGASEAPVDLTEGVAVGVMGARSLTEAMGTSTAPTLVSGKIMDADAEVVLTFDGDTDLLVIRDAVPHKSGIEATERFAVALLSARLMIFPY
jgi:hypothetical protein